ncbi:PAB-dependent poly(A)-specific ribonuclease subunit [Acrasis kona]|uniref:PAB-dependent poly(A)-specific ribonuclease subunit n=1 Tax=Acrasis kona TaxID=1008807 RepID=A0AAW2YTB2_9EUKA
MTTHSYTDTMLMLLDVMNSAHNNSFTPPSKKQTRKRKRSSSVVINTTKNLSTDQVLSQLSDLPEKYDAESPIIIVNIKNDQEETCIVGNPYVGLVNGNKRALPFNDHEDCKRFKTNEPLDSFDVCDVANNLSDPFRTEEEMLCSLDDILRTPTTPITPSFIPVPAKTPALTVEQMYQMSLALQQNKDTKRNDKVFDLDMDMDKYIML